MNPTKEPLAAVCVGADGCTHPVSGWYWLGPVTNGLSPRMGWWCTSSPVYAARALCQHHAVAEHGGWGTPCPAPAEATGDEEVVLGLACLQCGEEHNDLPHQRPGGTP